MLAKMLQLIKFETFTDNIVEELIQAALALLLSDTYSKAISKIFINVLYLGPGDTVEIFE